MPSGRDFSIRQIALNAASMVDSSITAVTASQTTPRVVSSLVLDTNRST